MSVAHVEEPRGHTGPWTIADVEALPEPLDGTRYEILTPGVLTMSPAPATLHQRVSMKLSMLLIEAAGDRDVEVLTTLNLEIPAERLCIPDVLVVDGAVADTDPVRWTGKDIHAVVEIVSPSSRPHDRIIKPQLYAEAEIPTYWRFETEKTPQLIVFELRRGRYARVATVRAGEPAEVPIPYPVTVDPAEVVRRRHL
ncbi:MAG: Uma2 family endonuclease [Micromonosporaceae bacterium]